MSTDPDSAETVSHQGKLAHLDAVSSDSLRSLSLVQRYTLIQLSGPWLSDDLGRFQFHSRMPVIPGVSEVAARGAINRLVKARLVRKWHVYGQCCYEVAGAYSCRRGGVEAAQKAEKIAGVKKKKTDKCLLVDRKRDLHLESDDSYVDSIAEEPYLFTRDNRYIPDTRKTSYLSTVPVPDGVSKYDGMLIKPPAGEYTGLRLSLLPSFDPAADLSMLGSVVRHLLLAEADDYGRVRIDVPLLWENLGRGITVHVSKAELADEIHTMIATGHLRVVDTPGVPGRFAFLRDAAQHKLNRHWRYHSDIPKLHADPKHTYDSPRYLDFFKACRDHDLDEVRVFLDNDGVTKHGVVRRVYERAADAAKDFVRDAEAARASQVQRTDEQFCLGAGSGYFWREGVLCEPTSWYEGGRGLPASGAHRFWYAVESGQPAAVVESVYADCCHELSGARESAILSCLLRMTPSAYIEKLRQGEPVAPRVRKPVGEDVWASPPQDYPWLACKEWHTLPLELQLAGNETTRAGFVAVSAARAGRPVGAIADAKLVEELRGRVSAEELAKLPGAMEEQVEEARPVLSCPPPPPAATEDIPLAANEEWEAYHAEWLAECRAESRVLSDPPPPPATEDIPLAANEELVVPTPDDQSLPPSLAAEQVDDAKPSVAERSPAGVAYDCGYSL